MFLVRARRDPRALGSTQRNQTGKDHGEALQAARLMGEPARREDRRAGPHTSTMPFIYPHLALMPDAHLGLGATVGSVIPTLGAIIPAAVGVDIGCGMIAVQTQFAGTDLPADRRAAAGADRARHPALGRAVQPQGRRHRRAADRRAREARRGEGRLRPRRRTRATGASSSARSASATTSSRSRVDETDRVWLFLHSGTRGVGNKIAQHHIAVAKRLAAQWWITCPTPTSPTSSRARRSSRGTSPSCGGRSTSPC